MDRQEKRTPASIVKDFKESCDIQHLILTTTKRRVINRINQPLPPGVIIIVGPTGVGKSYLKNSLIKHYCEKFEKRPIGSNPGQIPIAAMDVRAPLYQRFSWSECFSTALDSLHEPLIPFKTIIDEKGKMIFARREKDAARVLRKSLENALIYRKPKTFIWDEGQGVVDLDDDESVIRQLDVLKCLVDVTKVPIILLGHYGLQKALDLSGQLIRRSDVFYFAPYKVEIDSDVEEFQKVLIQLKEKLPIDCFDIEDKWEYCMSRTAGCVGIMKEWLVKALAATIEFGSPKLTERHLKYTALTLGQVEVIEKEICEGEKKLSMFFSEDEEKRAILLELVAQQRAAEKKKKEFNTRPGRRKPSRDEVKIDDLVLENETEMN